MSFNDNSNNFGGNSQSTGASNLRDNYSDMKDRYAGSGFDNDRGFQSNAGIGSANSGFDRINDPSTGSSFNNTGSSTNEQSGRSYGNTKSGGSSRDATNSASSNANRRENIFRDNAPNTQPHQPSKGAAGVMESSFGAENTTTSTFEKSQGQSFGHGFDQSRQKPRQDTGVDRGQQSDRRQADHSQTKTGAAAGGSAYAAGQNKGSKNEAERTSDSFATENKRSSGDSSGHKEGLGQKLVNKAEGLLHHGHKGEIPDNRTSGGY
ncbi:hypothetical protein PISL3812_03363 [Talaromyces islandicus]|uniref:Uncharacterized protein n=1 Tax=Talaromyces islandicus TaxID=28573 RepID=A0A0U1LSJ8_TALIS|nr:hypothetical protein PISL3812_03363 [Talaromyces islandicus]